jgi:hypothetical protein
MLWRTTGRSLRSKNARKRRKILQGLVLRLEHCLSHQPELARDWRSTPFSPLLAPQITTLPVAATNFTVRCFAFRVSYGWRGGDCRSSPYRNSVRYPCRPVPSLPRIRSGASDASLYLAVVRLRTTLARRAEPGRVAPPHPQTLDMTLRAQCLLPAALPGGRGANAYEGKR